MFQVTVVEKLLFMLLLSVQYFFTFTLFCKADLIEIVSGFNVYTKRVLKAKLSQMLSLSHLLSVQHDPGIVMTRVEGSFVTVLGD